MMRHENEQDILVFQTHVIYNLFTSTSILLFPQRLRPQKIHGVPLVIQHNAKAKDWDSFETAKQVERASIMSYEEKDEFQSVVKGFDVLHRRWSPNGPTNRDRRRIGKNLSTKFGPIIDLLLTM
jgi:hypothetical protein